MLPRLAQALLRQQSAPDFPTPADLAPEVTPEDAAAVLEALRAGVRDGRLDAYRQLVTHEWLVTIEAKMRRSPAEYRMTLREWALRWLACRDALSAALAKRQEGGTQ
ncbi:MAG TPA: hypothetical protein VF120_09170 [Ktedonobacterales bacterium]